LEQSHQDFSDLQVQHDQLTKDSSSRAAAAAVADYETLTKRVLFADEQLEEYTQRHAELEARYVHLQTELQQVSQDYQWEVSSLKTHVGTLHGEKLDLYASLQQAMDQQKKTQGELETLEEVSKKDKERLQALSTQLETSVSAKVEMETSFLAQLQEQKNLVEQEQAKGQEQQAQWQAQLDTTLQQVNKLQQALEASQSNMGSLETEQLASTE
jgi:chromosome segregation ATPase